MSMLRFRFRCQYCDEPLNGVGYKLFAYQFTQEQVTSSSCCRICNSCYPQIERALAQTLARIRIAKLQQTWGNVKPDTPAVK